MTTNLDWTEISTRFEGIKDTFDGIEFFGLEEFEREKLNRLTYGLVESPWASSPWNKAKAGRALPVSADRFSFLYDLVALMAADLDLPAPAGIEDAYRLPEDKRSDHFKIVEDAIRDRQFSAEFFRSWTRLVELQAQFLVLQYTIETTRERAKSKFEGAVNSSVAQRHWYAHWVVQNTPSLEPKDREQAQLDLAELCGKIVDGELAPWGPYPVEWYKWLLAKKDNPEDGDDINDELRKLGAPTIERMSRQKFLTPDVLPPLSAEGFSKAR